MRQFSVIIPTMQKCPEIMDALMVNLDDDPAVGEIIVIDNSETGETPVYNSKTIPIQFTRNAYVNPSWNFGVQKASNEFIALLNDDILIPKGIFSVLSQVPIEATGILGAYEPMIQPIDTFDPYDLPQPLQLYPTDQRCNGFGIFMVMHKDNYQPIPKELKVWCGDDLTFHRLRKARKRNGMMMFPIKTKMSSTSDLPQFDVVKKQDLIHYERIKQEEGL